MSSARVWPIAAIAAIADGWLARNQPRPGEAAIPWKMQQNGAICNRDVTFAFDNPAEEGIGTPILVRKVTRIESCNPSIKAG